MVQGVLMNDPHNVFLQKKNVDLSKKLNLSTQIGRD